MNDAAKDLILGVFEASLEAQLRAVTMGRLGQKEDLFFLHCFTRIILRLYHSMMMQSAA